MHSLRQPLAALALATILAAPLQSQGDTVRVGTVRLDASVVRAGVDSSHTFLLQADTRRLVMTYVEETQAMPDGWLIVGRNVNPAGQTVSLDSVALMASLAPRWHSDVTRSGSSRVMYHDGRLRGVRRDTSGNESAIDAVVARGAFDYSVATRLVAALPLTVGYSGVLATHDISRGVMYVPFRVLADQQIDVNGTAEAAWRVEITLTPILTATSWISMRTRKRLRIIVPTPNGQLVVESLHP